ncbi:MAG: YegS/Rv2252/BmrU family lipid kinase [Oscillospiraceae bacterium]|jgi:YegS/Rv2252/BmrU family lipid kinase|nr:YegS/Rv2252/BmrU family lipid kinase [Oscillospiraceae bacterium]
MKQLLLVMNPCSGKKRANRCLAEIIAIFNRADYNVTAHMTACRADATNIVAQRGREFDLIVCIGGDGTFNEVISGVMQAELDLPLGYIPAGSTNDFANSLGIPKDILKAARDIVEGSPQNLDIGRFNDRYFSYVASFGAFTRASYATAQSAKNSLGHLAYILSSIREIPAIRSQRLRFTLADGTVLTDDYIFGAVSNSTSVAGVLTLSPELVDMRDGLFELMLLRKPRSPLEMSDCVLALTTQDYHSPMLTLVSSSRIEIEAPADMPWTLDGEKEEGRERCVAENLHNAIRVIINKP